MSLAWADVEAKENGYYKFGGSFVNISAVEGA